MHDLSEMDPFWRAHLKRNCNSHRMAIMLAEGAFEDAIAVGEKREPSGIVIVGQKSLIVVNIPFLQDVLARTYYLNGDLEKAIAEYERLITFDPKSNDRRLIHPKYHYRLAKLYEEKGLKEKAIGEFEKFLELWKDADKDLPELVDANSRLANLAK